MHSGLGGEWRLKVTSGGRLFECWEEGVPGIPRQWLDSVVYLYSSEEKARTGHRSGGSGFLLCLDPLLPGMHPTASHLYAVTNAHVVEGGATVVRINTMGGGADVIPLTFTQWRCHPDGDDVAVAPLALDATFRFSMIPGEMSVTRQHIVDDDLAAGDEAIFFSRYMPHDAADENRPLIRSGIIAQLDGHPVFQGDRPSGARYQESILVEERSLSGASGSPVFAYRSSRTMTTGPNTVVVMPQVGLPLRLLGVNWGHHHMDESVRAKSNKRKMPMYVHTNSGIALVVPAWKLTELLDTFGDNRRETEEAYLQENGPYEEESAATSDLSEDDTVFPEPTADLMNKLLQVPKEEANEVHRNHE